MAFHVAVQSSSRLVVLGNWVKVVTKKKKKKKKKNVTKKEMWHDRESYAQSTYIVVCIIEFSLNVL